MWNSLSNEMYVVFEYGGKIYATKTCLDSPDDEINRRRAEILYRGSWGFYRDIAGKPFDEPLPMPGLKEP